MPKELKKRSRNTTLHSAADAAGGRSNPKEKKLGRGSSLLAPIKSFGQNFLKNPMVVQSIVEKAGIRSSDVVLEIGPGTGNLTVQMLERARKVIAIEFDPRMIRELLKRVEGTDLERKLQVIHGDVMKVALPYFDLCVANIPYNISSPLLFKLLSHRPMYRSAVIMFQEEFAMRLTANPGSELYCRLSVNTQLVAKVEHLLKVGRNNFRPPPKVDSRVVRITLINPPPPINFTEWDGLVRLIFNRKHKTLRALLTNKSTLKMLEANLKTFRSIANDASFPATASVAMDDSEDGNGESGHALTGTDEVKKIIQEVCERDEFRNVRSGTMDQDDILALLTAFNTKGVHFS